MTTATATMADDAQALSALATAAETHRYAPHELRKEYLDKCFADSGELEAACESFRRKHYPKRHRIVAVGGRVFSVSATGRVTLLWGSRD